MGNVCRKSKDARSTRKLGFGCCKFSKWYTNVTSNVDKEEVVLAELPLEVITQVLMWLPVKSLLRFRCVSKSFCALIDSQSFINLHLNCSSRDRSHLKLIFPTRYLISTNCNSAKIHVSNFDSSTRAYRGLKVFGYCKGVFLLLSHTCKPALWNPSTRQLRVLPRFPGHKRSNDIRMGLGYDSSQDEYKVVAIYTFSNIHQLVTIKYEAWVFDLRSNSWKRVCSDFLSEVYAFSYESHFGYFVHGALHWLFANATTFHDIVGFDTVKETFSILPQPPNKGLKAAFSSLNVLDGCLCISYLAHRSNGEARLYVRKKDGAEFVWSLLYLVIKDQLPRFLKAANFLSLEVLGFSKDGNEIMLDLGLQFMVSFDLNKKRFQPTEITRPTQLYRLCQTRQFVESLVSI